MNTLLRTAWMDEDGLTTVEYALMLALVSIAAISAWTLLGRRISNAVTNVTTTGLADQ